jgi:hypothetical protein
VNEILFVEVGDRDSRFRSSLEAGMSSCLRLPAQECQKCGVDYEGPALPTVAQFLADIRQACRERGFDHEAVMAMSRAVDRGPVDNPLSPPQFLTLLEIVREVAGIDQRFPIRPRARIEPLVLAERHLGRSIYAGGEDDDMILVDRAAMARLEGLTGLSFSPCVNPAGAGETELWEAVVTGAATNLMTEAQINEFWLEEYGLEDPDNDPVRCPLCQRLPERAPLFSEKARIIQYTNVFRLRDFSGIYVDSEGLRVLGRVFPNDLAFWAIA